VKVANVLARPGVFARQNVEIFSKKQVTEKGTWYQLFARPLGPVDPEELQAVQGTMNGFNYEEAAA
jgi:hypothetical protein